MKKIYFAASIRGGRDDLDLYKSLISYMQQLPCTLLTEHIGLESIKAMGESGKSERQIYNRDMNWLKQSDGVVAEVSTPSLGVGYEIAQAEILNKPVLALYRSTNDRALSAMIAGSTRIRLVRYSHADEVMPIIRTFVSQL